MRSIKPVESWGCFMEVANVIGVGYAARELNRVRGALMMGGNFSMDLEKELLESFEWDASPQGDTFWADIDEGRVPNNLHPIKEDTERTLQVGDEIILGSALKDTQALADFAGRRVVVIGLCNDIDDDMVMVVQDKGSSGFRAILATESAYTFAETAEEERWEKVLEDWRAYSVRNRLDGLDDVTTVRDVVNFVLHRDDTKPEIVKWETLVDGEILEFVGYEEGFSEEENYQYAVGERYVVGRDMFGDFGPKDAEGHAPNKLNGYKFIRVK